MIDYGSLKPGVSGMMRVKDDAAFIPACNECCIDALDELVIVYNDCTDDSPRVIEEMRQKYPEKIHVFPYEHHIMALNLTREEYEFVKSLPEDDPRLLRSYYNYALDKVRYQWAVKIDADQLYFTDRMKDWCEFLREETEVRLSLSVVLGCIMHFLIKVNARLNRELNRVIRIIPSVIGERSRKCYDSFVKYRVKKGNACVMLSGVNVFRSKGKWVVPLGLMHDVINLIPPFNGEGDHLFFKVAPECRYVKYDYPSYSRARTEKYTLIEGFRCPDTRLVGGFFWFHLNMMRSGVNERVERVISENPDSVIELDTFLRNDFYELEKNIPSEMLGIRARSKFQFIYPYGKEVLEMNKPVFPVKSSL